MDDVVERPQRSFPHLTHGAADVHTLVPHGLAQTLKPEPNVRRVLFPCTSQYSAVRQCPIYVVHKLIISAVYFRGFYGKSASPGRPLLSLCVMTWSTIDLQSHWDRKESGRLMCPLTIHNIKIHNIQR